MNWEEFKLALNWFVVGAVFGYGWNPIWTVVKKVWQEAKLAKQEWRQPRD